jgi:hypothetical protein
MLELSYCLNWVVFLHMQQLFTIHFLENNLAMAELRFWQSTFSGLRAFSFIGIPQNLNNHFRGSSLKRRLKKTVLKCENV